MPSANGEGNYFIDDEGLKELEKNRQILLTYCDKFGEIENPNGSVAQIAGIKNKAGNVFGLMPHPERAMQELLGSDDGKEMLRGFIS